MIKITKKGNQFLLHLQYHEQTHVHIQQTCKYIYYIKIEKIGCALQSFLRTGYMLLCKMKGSISQACTEGEEQSTLLPWYDFLDSKIKTVLL